MEEEDDRRYKLEDYLNYRDLLNSSMEHADQRGRMFYNDSYVHAAMVVESIIRLATQEKRHIKMYCGEFSIFRDNFCKKIHKLKEEIEPHDNPSLHDAWAEFDPYRDLKKALEDYFNIEEAMFQLIVEKDIQSLKEETVWDIVESAMKNNRLSVERIIEPSGLCHFIVSGNSYRKESSDKEKTAICCFDDNVTAQILQSNFDTLKRKTEKCFSF